MPDKYADALWSLEDAVTSAVADAEDAMTKREIARELRRIAFKLEN